MCREKNRQEALRWFKTAEDDLDKVCRIFPRWKTDSNPPKKSAGPTGAHSVVGQPLLQV